MGCYEIPSNFLVSIKEELKDEIQSVCNVWDAMESFDGIFIEEDSSERYIDVTPSKSGYIWICHLGLHHQHQFTSIQMNQLDIRKTWIGFLGNFFHMS